MEHDVSLQSLLFSEDINAGTTFVPNPDSSTLMTSMTYSPKSQVLKVRFKKSGEVYRYTNVPASVVKKIKMARRPGKVFYDMIRASTWSYPYVKEWTEAEGGLLEEGLKVSA